MEHVKMIKKVIERKKNMVLKVLIILIMLFIVGTGFFKVKRHQDVQPNQKAPSDEQVNMVIYSQFQKLYDEEKECLQTINTELCNEDILNDKEYLIIINGRNNGGKYITETMEFYFEESKILSEKHKELADILNENNTLIEALNAIKQSGLVNQIAVGSGEIAYAVNTKFTTFIRSNNGITNYLIYSTTDNDLEKYGYKKIEDNWYMYIPSRPE